LITQTPAGSPLPPIAMRLATTRGTNALLERKGARTALFITQGFGDLLVIGDQQRPEIFALRIIKPEPVYEAVIEVPERLTADGTVLRAFDPSLIEAPSRELLKRGIRSAAVALDGAGATARVAPPHGCARRRRRGPPRPARRPRSRWCGRVYLDAAERVLCLASCGSNPAP
jgi:hypothetical protein